MEIAFVRVDPKTHRVTVRRGDGSQDTCVLETKSLLLHDFVHYAIEAHQGISDGLWGHLAAGHRFADLHPATGAPTVSHPDLMIVERLVGPMQSVFRQSLPAKTYVDMGLAPFVDAAWVEAVRERVRKLWGHWLATPQGQAMRISWPPQSAMAAQEQRGGTGSQQLP